MTEPQMTPEQARQILADEQATKIQAFGLRLQALQDEFQLRLIARPRYTPDGRTEAYIEAIEMPSN